MEESRNQTAQTKPVRGTRKHSRRKQQSGASNQTNLGRNKSSKLCSVSNVAEAKTTKLRPLLLKPTTLKALCKPARLKNVSTNAKPARLKKMSTSAKPARLKNMPTNAKPAGLKSVATDAKSRTSPLSGDANKTTSPRCVVSFPASYNERQPSLSVLQALEKLLSAIKVLCNQDCLVAMMAMDIQFSSKSGCYFEPKDEEWPDLQGHLLSLQICLQDLRSSLESQQSEEPETASDPMDSETERADVSCERAAPADVSSEPAPPAEVVSSERAPPEDEGAAEDPDWLLEPPDPPADSPEPPAAGEPIPQERLLSEADSSERFPCTSGCEEKPGVVRQFASEKSLRMHMAACHGQRAAGRRYPEYTCPLCGSVQKRPRDLAAHMTSCQGQGRSEPRPPPPPEPADSADPADSTFVMCRLCHLCFPTGDLLQQHCCQYADCNGIIQDKIGRGELTVSGAELALLHRFICHQCQEEFRNRLIYRVHLQFCTAPPYPCELCEEACSTGRQLVQHKMAQHRELNKPLFFCRAAGCGLSFRLNAALQKHMVQRHATRGPGQPYGCDVCDKKFIKKIYLTHHKLRYHHDLLQRDFVCDVCGARLGSSSALNVHVKSVHARPEHTCDVCGKVFARQDRLRIHAKIHTGIKPFQCSLCPKAFIQQCKLYDHMRRHRGEKRFRCVMCDKMYAASHDLRSHLRRVHSVDMVNKTHTIQPVSSLLRPLPPPEPEPEPLGEPQLTEPTQEQVQLPAAVQHPLHGVQLHSVQVAAPAQALHVQDLTQLGRGVILIPAVDASGGTSFYPIINQ